MPQLDLDQGGRKPQVHRTYLGPSLGWILTDEPTYTEFLIVGGGGAVISTGLKGYLVIPEWVTVTSWTLIASSVGSIQMDIWKVPLATFLAGTAPSSANTIVGNDAPILSNEIADTSSLLTGWTTFIEQNDVLAFVVASCTGISRVTLLLKCLRNKGVW